MILRDIARAFPSVTSVRVKDALDTVNDIVGKLVLAIRGASGVAVVASLFVLAGAIAAGHGARLYDAVVLKVLGATRGRLLLAYTLEYGALGLATAVFGLLAGTLASWAIVTRVMKLDFALDLSAPSSHPPSRWRSRSSSALPGLGASSVRSRHLTCADSDPGEDRPILASSVGMSRRKSCFMKCHYSSTVPGE